MTEKTEIAELQEFFISQKKANRYFRYYLENCVRCGSCIENCHFYQGDYTNDLNAPVFKNEQVRRLIKQQSLLGKLGLYGRPSSDYVDSLSYAVFESCTNCRRCVIFCPFSIDISISNTIARAGLIKIDKAPEMLLMLADMQIQRREFIDDYIEMFTEQVNDLENEIRKEIGDKAFQLLLNQINSDDPLPTKVECVNTIFELRKSTGRLN